MAHKIRATQLHLGAHAITFPAVPPSSGWVGSADSRSSRAASRYYAVRSLALSAAFAAAEMAPAPVGLCRHRH
ncbi:hypothetical protein [Streptomyces sp. NPDC001985]|uniref:hypothetical protein n=1 Tax=Streptomyces sp. NPDC001985 TaxID=3154406 RepID=UPI00332C575C